MTQVNTDNQKTPFEISACHNASVKVVSDSFGEGTNYYECLVCNEPCDLANWPAKAVEVNTVTNDDVKDNSWIDILKELSNSAWSMGLQGASPDDLKNDRQNRMTVQKAEKAIEAELVRIIGPDSDYTGIDGDNGVADMIELARLSSLDNLRSEQRKRAGV